MSTTFAQAREAIYDLWATGWASTSVDYAFANEARTPPQNAAWARVAVVNEVSEQETLGGNGNRRFIRGGRVIVQLFTPVDVGFQGSPNMDSLATTARNIFEGERDGDLWFPRARIREIGEDGKHNQVNIEAVFFYDETK